MPEKKFAAFIMTYERHNILEESIQNLFSQTLPPEKILIVDNSVTYESQRLIYKLNIPNVEYYRVGYNSGPAGASAIGLMHLAKQGYKWIFWCDDDNPPPFENCLEELIALAEKLGDECGQVGIVGHNFNKLKGTFIRTPDADILNSEFLPVHYIGGGSAKTVNSKVILQGIIPEEKLFFGFEDLDFDLALQKNGFRSYVHSKLFWQCRKKFNKDNYQHTINLKKDNSRFWREYYSIRNMLYILRKNKLYVAFCLNIILLFGKILLSIRHGFTYSVSITKLTCNAIADSILNKFHMRMKPVNKSISPAINSSVTEEASLSYAK